MRSPFPFLMYLRAGYMVWTYILCVLLAQIFMFLTTDDVSGAMGREIKLFFFP